MNSDKQFKKDMEGLCMRSSAQKVRIEKTSELPFWYHVGVWLVMFNFGFAVGALLAV